MCSLLTCVGQHFMHTRPHGLHMTWSFLMLHNVYPAVTPNTPHSYITNIDQSSSWLLPNQLSLESDCLDQCVFCASEFRSHQRNLNVPRTLQKAYICQPQVWFAPNTCTTMIALASSTHSTVPVSIPRTTTTTTTAT